MFKNGLPNGNYKFSTAANNKMESVNRIAINSYWIDFRAGKSIWIAYSRYSLAIKNKLYLGCTILKTGKGVRNQRARRESMTYEPFCTHSNFLSIYAKSNCWVHNFHSNTMLIAWTLDILVWRILLTNRDWNWNMNYWNGGNQTKIGPQTNVRYNNKM